MARHAVTSAARRVGAYVLGEPLGQGGTATVWRARSSADGAEVAAKILSLDDVDDPPVLLARYQRIATLDHPHILPILDVGVADQTLYVVTPLAQGGSLRQLLQRGQLDRHLTLQLLGQVASALQYLHAREIVHLDVKPANILLGDGGHPLLGDFGLVQPRPGPTGRPRVRGTPAYMAPEQCLAAPLGPASDQYALAVMSFELLTGRRPFIGGAPETMLLRQVSEPPPAASHVCPQLPREVDAVLMRGLAKDPSLRFSSVASLAAALRRALASAPAGAPPHDANAPPAAATLDLVTLEPVTVELAPGGRDAACN